MRLFLLFLLDINDVINAVISIVINGMTGAISNNDISHNVLSDIFTIFLTDLHDAAILCLLKIKYLK